MADGHQFDDVEHVIRYLEVCVNNRTAVGLGYDLRNALFCLAQEVRKLKETQSASSLRTTEPR